MCSVAGVRRDASPCFDGYGAVRDAFDLQCKRQAGTTIAATQTIKMLSGDVEARRGFITGQAGSVNPTGKR